VLDSGKVVLDAAADAVRGAMTSVSGPALAVTEFTAGRSVASRRRMGARETAVLAGALDDADRARARSLRLSLEPLTLQQVVIHAADGPLAESTATGSTGTDNTGARERTSA
jgi:ABC-2 type transport system ATP-binding protein